MLIDELIFQIIQQFELQPTTEQKHVLTQFAHFMMDEEPRVVMIFCGSAGTGKTSLASAIARTMVKLEQKVMLLAPTGRAAKVFSVHSGQPAYTIHRQIYRQKSFDSDGGVFNLNFNRYSDTLFMVDESSMIANQGQMESSFGSGCLLDDLVQFVYSGRNCRMILMGDAAQLPPIGEEQSPALSSDFMEGYGLKVYECRLDNVLRQSEESGILYNASLIRTHIMRDELTQLPQIHFDAFADIVVVPGNELIEMLNSSYSQVGVDETMVITRSNKRAHIYNQGIRQTILGSEEELSTGDMLMIVRNNYHWVQPPTNNEEQDTTSMTFLANGDRAMVQRVRNIRELYGFRFADVWLQFPDYNDYELEATIILDSLHTEAPALSREQNERLFNEVLADYADIPRKQDRVKKLREDIFLNAVQVKYAYAITCHKAQGGQWTHVYVDQGYMTDEMLSPDYLHWLYTAFTRATEKLYLVNWPKSQTFEKGV
ncbi:ATP-dependent DNA helicase [Hoylesella timonensis]|uniref:ATP-dependent endonuclease n=1 Tax=Hoylesella timonensis TaxID=386414 RepID=A0A2N6Q8S0_9BACT|nr:ATP-binding domain-containing protein [Hoylesella timonensis]PMC11302.1 ATP-dependent endonuclease [Hoylesella timonensis]